MRAVPPEQVSEALRVDNPWWNSGSIAPDRAAFQRRAYFDLFAPLASAERVRRAILLVGPRRVGKTVMLHQLVQHLIDEGRDPRQLFMLSVDSPLYHGLSLDEMFARCRSAAGGVSPDGAVMIFDEIQYLPDWERHLKTLVDTYRSTRFIASGSAAAALRLKSTESGAGRFTDFVLPPLTFHEYLMLIGESRLFRRGSGTEAGAFFEAVDIDAANRHFIDYLNFGGYPEIALSALMRGDSARFVRGDIIEKVLLRDLPSLYGITDVPELNALFTTLAFNTAGEVSLEELSRGSGVAKNTIKRYIEYLEAAFLVKRVSRVDRSAKRFIRESTFKVYLTNPSMRAALFAPVTADHHDMGSLVETAVFAQWFHSVRTQLHYARWKQGEVDVVALDPRQRPDWACEVKWSDRYGDRPRELEALITFCREHGLGDAIITTRTTSNAETIEGVRLRFVPASAYCYTVGHNLVRGLFTTRAG